MCTVVSYLTLGPFTVGGQPPLRQVGLCRANYEYRYGPLASRCNQHGDWYGPLRGPVRSQAPRGMYPRLGRAGWAWVHTPGMELPSLDLVLSLLRDSREQRRAHFDALDQKAGIALGFAGVLVTLSPSVAGPWRQVGVVLAVVSGACSVAAFWPREFEVLDNPRKYLAAQPQDAALVFVDTFQEMNERTDKTLGNKARKIKCALVLLAGAVAVLAVGVIMPRGGDNSVGRSGSATASTASASGSSR